VNELVQSVPVYALTVFDVDEKDRLCMGQLLDFLSEERLTQIRAKKGELVLLLGRYFTTSSEQCFPSTARCDIITPTGERLYGFDIAPKRVIDGHFYESALLYTNRLASRLTEILNAHYDANRQFDDIEFHRAIRKEYSHSLPTTMLRDLVKLGQHNDLITFCHVSKAAVSNKVLEYCTVHGEVVVGADGRKQFQISDL
jgi:hypothetical protein